MMETDILKYIVFILHKLYQLSYMIKGVPLEEVLKQIKSDTMKLISQIKEKYKIDIEKITYRKEWDL